MTTDDPQTIEHPECCADLHRKVDRALELLEDIHDARLRRIKPDEIQETIEI